MIVFGERLNSSRSRVHKALVQKDKSFLIGEALQQQRAGAHYIDLNTATLLDKEIPTLQWIIPLLQEKITIPLSLDTPNPEAMEVGLSLHQGRAVMNSLTGETERIEAYLPLIKKYKPRIIVLCLDSEGLPKTAKKELSIARNMVSLLRQERVSPEDIFVDPLVQPIGVNQMAGQLFLDSLEKITKNLPEVKTIAGISNVSFGLPQRSLMNRTFLIMALQRGLDAAIIDPLDKKLIFSIHSALALLGKDPLLKGYLSFVRKRDLLPD
jgi:5-methyltetrahydrofolate--homocysteine methyltransferase